VGYLLESITEKKEDQIVYSDLLEHILFALTNNMNKKISEEEAIEVIINSINNLKAKYTFLNQIEITDKPDADGFYNIQVLQAINTIDSANIGKAIQNLIEELGKSSEWDDKEEYIEEFRKELDNEYLSQLKILKINLDNIPTTLLKLKQEILTRRILDAFVDILSEKTSDIYAVSTIDNIIENLKDTHDILKYIEINKSRYSEGSNAIHILPEISTVEPHDLGKAFKDIINELRNIVQEKKIEFIESFKRKMGEKCIADIEKIGINMNFLEMKFSIS
jgi:hypothetical protein